MSNDEEGVWDVSFAPEEITSRQVGGSIPQDWVILHTAGYYWPVAPNGNKLPPQRSLLKACTSIHTHLALPGGSTAPQLALGREYTQLSF